LELRGFFLFGQKQYFYGRPGLFVTEEPGRNNAGIIYYQNISFLEKIGQLEKIIIVNSPGRALQQHQARVIPLPAGMLGNQFFR
jgi:hypothetical protein